MWPWPWPWLVLLYVAAPASAQCFGCAVTSALACGSVASECTASVTIATDGDAESWQATGCDRARRPRGREGRAAVATRIVV